jgi:uncharacterized membrane protein (UPF0127 family)
MKTVRPLVPLVMAGSLALGACSGASRMEPNATRSDAGTVRASFSTSNGTVQTAPLWMADSSAERERGLMGRRSLPPDGGMVFRFPEPTDAGFWMKDTPLPLSIAFWGRDRRILAILDMEPCPDEPCPIYRPGASYETALEMRRGWFDQHGVEIGDRVELIPGSA